MNPKISTFNLKIIYGALLAGPILYLGLLLTISKDRPVNPIPNSELIGIGFGLVSAGIALFLPKILASNRTVENGQDSRYRLLKTIQWYVLESNILTNLTFYFLNNVITHVYTAIVLLVLLAFLFPSDEERKRYFPK